MIKYLKKIISKFVPKKLLYLNQKLRVLLLRGNNYQCPICKYKAKRFINYGKDNAAIKKYNIIGMGFRKNAICPNCYSKDRERMVYLYLIKLFEKKLISIDSKIIHFSPESSLERNFLRKKFSNYITADIVDGPCDHKIDLQNFNFDKKGFDLVICNHVLEHIESDDISLKNIYSLLNPKGFAILQVPMSDEIDVDYKKENIQTEEERIENYGQFDHVRIYAKKNYINKIENTGFSVDIDTMKDEKKILPMYGLNDKEFIVCALK